MRATPRRKPKPPRIRMHPAVTLRIAAVAWLAFAAPNAFAANADVSIKDSAFSPSVVTVDREDTVTWTNDDTLSHTATSQEDVFDSAVLAPGAMFSHLFETPGTYAYVCRIHPFMTGKVVVNGPFLTVSLDRRA
jgi:plastocyanin